uniref:uncharacterized protein LOC118551516 n=1 Tax=Halichoerus grypus TaxID=9711 RepID=UPI001658F03E|nr:uncharacterized protein LOC118551516 [Halichoerus grypus]
MGCAASLGLGKAVLRRPNPDPRPARRRARLPEGASVGPGRARRHLVLTHLVCSLGLISSSWGLTYSRGEPLPPATGGLRHPRAHGTQPLFTAGPLLRTPLLLPPFPVPFTQAFHHSRHPQLLTLPMSSDPFVDVLRPPILMIRNLPKVPQPGRRTSCLGSRAHLHKHEQAWLCLHQLPWTPGSSRSTSGEPSWKQSFLSPRTCTQTFLSPGTGLCGRLGVEGVSSWPRAARMQTRQNRMFITLRDRLGGVASQRPFSWETDLDRATATQQGLGTGCLGFWRHKRNSGMEESSRIASWDRDEWRP